MFSKLFTSIKGKGRRKDNSSASGENQNEPEPKVSVDKEIEQITKMPPEPAQPVPVGDSWVLDGVDSAISDTKVADDVKHTGEQVYRLYAGKSQKGYVPYNPRKVNQDYLLMREDEATHTLILGTFDGHGEHGHSVSEFVCDHFCEHLLNHEKWSMDMKTAALEALQQAENDCIENRFIKTEFSGTTAVVCMIRGDKLLVLNVGDSRAIMATEEGDSYRVLDLTHDHKPSLPEEKERIEKAGGRVFRMEYDDGYDGPARVWLADQDIPGLAMSRSLCDTVAHTVGVISTPEVVERTLTDDDRVIVMGSDGLWEFIPSDEVILLIKDCEMPEDAIDMLCTIAWKRWFDAEKVVDDTTVIVVFLGKEDPV